MKRILSAALTLPLLAAVGACGAYGSSAQPSGPQPRAAAATASAGALPTAPGSVTIGSADFPESELLAHLYADAMKARGVRTEIHADIGERAVSMAALKEGSIGAIPEYTGDLLAYLSSASTARTPQDIYARLRQAAGAQGLTVTAYAPAQDADTVTVTRATADTYHLSSIGDLKTVAHRLAFGAPAPTRTLPYGLPGLKSAYGVTFRQFVPLAPTGTITQNALRNNTVDAADIFSTDPFIPRYKLVSLKDPKHIFAAQNIVPLFRRDVLTQPMADACDAVSAKLTTTALAELDSQVANGASPDAVATTWLTATGLAH
ncbi:ABC transporter substrate-binding protein [Streptomyces sp. NPDC005708]|uniref:ABC transporter substrate-binding protein n=1 Tax=Streptomyces sp. NPDC005708 TaxID=3154564 RepID=UPI0033CB60C6